MTTTAAADSGTKRPSDTLIARFTDIVGEKHALADADAQMPYLREMRDRYVGRAALVLRPASVNEVSKILGLANSEKIAIVPQAGNTGLVGGQVPFESGDEIILSTARLNKVRDTDASGQSITVEAGMTLAAVQAEAEKINRLFPLSLPSEGSCQIGGNLATNAGGVNVLAYGNARDLVLGLEVVLADGRIWNGLKTLKKDNTGYDLKHLFMGSEGTLGIITAATLKLFPRPAEKSTGFVAIETLDCALALFRHMQAHTAGAMTAFEFIADIGLDIVTRHVEGAKNPFDDRHPWYVLIELSSPNDDGSINELLENTLMAAAEDGLILDATITRSGSQSADLWRLREELSDAQKLEGGSIKHDVSVPIARIPEFIERAAAIVERVCPQARPCPFGHFGDGNVHYNISQPVGMDKDAFLAKWEAMNEAIHVLVVEMDGSISAEHGIGRMKRDELKRFKPALDLEMMRAIKKALDPNGILNPGKVI